MIGKPSENSYTVLIWDDFHDDGSEEGALVGRFKDASNAIAFARACARIEFELSGSEAGSEAMTSWTVYSSSGAILYNTNAHPIECQCLPDQEDLTLVRRGRSSLHKGRAYFGDLDEVKARLGKRR
jgi:hypothetical protein